MRTSFLVIFFAFPILVFSQSNYRNGFIIKNNGDTLKGYINYKEWQQSPTSISFKNTHDQQALEFNAKTLKGFEITGLETYITYIGKISTDPNQTLELSTGIDTSSIQDTIFLKQLITGKIATLYLHEDKIKTRYFMSETGKKVEELRYHQFYTTNNSSISTLPLYKYQLEVLLTKYRPSDTKLKNVIERASYTNSDLKKIFSILNTGSYTIDNSISKRKKPPIMRLFAGVELGFSKTEFKGTNEFSGPRETILIPKITAGFDVFANSSIQRTIIRAELALSTNSPEFKATSNGTEYYYSFKQYTAAFTPQLIYNIYNTPRFKFFLDAGVSLNFSIYKNDESTTIYEGVLGPKVSSTQNPYNLEPLWISIPIKAGVTLTKRIELYVGVTSPSSISRYAFYTIDNSSYSIGGKILF